jgi:hypothetical protein
VFGSYAVFHCLLVMRAASDCHDIIHDVAPAESRAFCATQSC